MTLKKALIMEKSLSNYIEGLKDMVKTGEFNSNDLCELINLKTAIDLELTEQLKGYKSLVVVANSLKDQMKVASVGGNLELYKNLQKQYEPALISVEQYLIDNQFKIDDTLMSKFCSFAE